MVVNQPLQVSGNGALRLRCDWLSDGADRLDDLRRVRIFKVEFRIYSASKASRKAVQADIRASKAKSYKPRIAKKVDRPGCQVAEWLSAALSYVATKKENNVAIGCPWFGFRLNEFNFSTWEYDTLSHGKLLKVIK